MARDLAWTYLGVIVPMATLLVVRLIVRVWASLITLVPVVVHVGLVCTVTIGLAMSAIEMTCFYWCDCTRVSILWSTRNVALRPWSRDRCYCLRLRLAVSLVLLELGVSMSATFVPPIRTLILLSVLIALVMICVIIVGLARLLIRLMVVVLLICNCLIWLRTCLAAV